MRFVPSISLTSCLWGYLIFHEQVSIERRQHVRVLTLFSAILVEYHTFCGPGSSVGILTDYGLDCPGIESRWDEIFRRPDQPWGPPSLLYNGYRVFPKGKERPGHAADHSPPSSAAVMEK